jgi:ATP-dependent DNA helicase PIF1
MPTMESKYCCRCIKKQLMIFFLATIEAPSDSTVYKMCISCREKGRKRRRADTSTIDTRPTHRSRPLPTPFPAPLPISPPTVVSEPDPPVPMPIGDRFLPDPPVPIPTGDGFLPAAEWQYIQDFNESMEAVKMETCLRCQEHWFEMQLKDDICHRCFLWDRKKDSSTPDLMSAANNMDPGGVPAHLPTLTQVEEMVIARSHVQMLLKRVRGHQYQYSGHCVSFMQNIVKTVSILPNLPSELDIVLLRPATEVTDQNPRYQRQFRSDFRVRRSNILIWLYFLKDNHPDYKWVTISTDRLNALPVDDDVSSSIVCITDDAATADDNTATDDRDPEAEPPPTAMSVVLNLDIDTTESDLIRQQITGHNPPIAAGIPAPDIRATPIDEAAGKERIFAMAFPTLFPTGDADFNTSRSRSVSLKDYAQHLLRWKDGRFGRHPRFRFLIFNIYMRQQASSTARFYVSKASGISGLTLDQLTEALDTDVGLLPQIVRQGASLIGTRPYWRNKSNDLLAQARFLSQTTSPVFITFSCADMQWYDLQRHQPRFADYQTATDNVRQKIVWENVQNGPHIITQHLDIRFRAFLKYVVRPYLKYIDYWFRYEWQARGSGHLHCLFWLDGPPLDQLKGPAGDRFAEYWGSRVTAENPDQIRPPDSRNPAALQPTAVTNTSDQFAALLNRLQMHSQCRPSYCLRSKAGSLDQYCRFWFPRPLSTIPMITDQINHKNLMFAPRRNQATVNQCSPVILMGWLANIDIQPATTLHAVLTYIGKYVSKPEKSSASYTELQSQVLPYTNSRAPLLSFVSKMLNKLIGERDWSAQEVSHILLGLQTQDASRDTITVDCRPEELQQDIVTVEEGAVNAKRSPIRRYRDRLKDAADPTLRTVTLFAWLQSWNWTTWRLRPRAPRRVLNYYPKYSNDPTSPHFLDYCRVKLMLHHPFTEFTDLLTVNETAFESYSGALAACQSTHNHPEDFYTDPIQEESDDDSDTESIASDHATPLADFEVFARRRPQGADDEYINLTMDLGSRNIDRNYDWTPHVGRFSTTPTDWATFRAANVIEQDVTVDSSPTVLNLEQRKLYDIIITQYSQELESSTQRPLLLNVDGVAGSGKTFTLLKACSRLQEMAQAADRPNPVFRAAPTGIAAFNFVGKTLHSLLRLPVKKKSQQDRSDDLSNATVQSLQAVFQPVRFLIIDEKSMVDIKNLSLIDDRLRIIYPTRSSEPFGGLNILLCGDFFQLPPVGGRAMFSTAVAGPEAIKGQGLYRLFDRTVKLTQVMRQLGEDDIAVRFREALSELRALELSRPSWELLCSRVENLLAPDEVANFSTALRLYFTNVEVNECNYTQLAAQNRPVKKIIASHQGRNASLASDEEADGLNIEFYICIGARVMLTWNLWIKSGLANGSIGEVVDIIWDIGQDPAVTMPSVLLVQFSDYTGPDFPGYPPKTVPIFPVTRPFEFRGVSCSRTQFPLRLAYAITVHKSQGLTPNRVVLNLARKDRTPGLSYVAISRVKSLQGIMFEAPFDLERFDPIHSTMVQDREIDKILRESQLI